MLSFCSLRGALALAHTTFNTFSLVTSMLSLVTDGNPSVGCYIIIVVTLGTLPMDY